MIYNYSNYNLIITYYKTMSRNYQNINEVEEIDEDDIEELAVLDDEEEQTDDF